MSRVISILESIFLYPGISKTDLEAVKSSIHRQNAEVIPILTLPASFVFGVGFILSCFMPFFESNHPLYLIVFLCAFPFYIISRTTGQKHLIINTIIVYLVTGILYAYGIYLGSIAQTEMPAVTFCVCLTVIPMLISDIPIHIDVQLTIAEIIFILSIKAHKSGDVFGSDLSNSLCFYVIGLAIASWTNRTKMRELKQRIQIEQERDTDSLTGILTRGAMEIRINKYIMTETDPAACIIMDVDNFKGINDTYGHAQGDKVLQELANCISTVFRKADIVGRYGGDEFVLCMTHITGKEIVARKLDELTGRIEKAIMLPNGNSPHISIGIAMYNGDGKPYAKLIRMADKALYEAKEKGKNCYVFAS